MLLPGITPLVSLYSLFLLDLYGVIHDGRNLYPGALEALRLLRREGKRVVFISNSPRRSDTVAKHLHDLGLREGDYDAVVTSGDVTYDFLAICPFGKQARAYVIRNPMLDDLAEMAGYRIVPTIETADFILAIGLTHDDAPRDEQLGVLKRADERHLPMVCANPDIEIVRQSGDHVWCAGVMAEQYQAMGGRVYAFGKPYAPIYEAALALLARQGIVVKQDEIIAVGDNLHTDVLGGNRSGFSSCLVAGGILTGKLPFAELPQWCRQQGIVPTWAIELFQK